MAVTAFIGGKDAYATYVEYDALTSGNVDTVTHSMSFGAVHSTRRIAAEIFAAVTSSKFIQSVTIGGVAATREVKTQNGSPTILSVETWVAKVPTGTTGDVVITLDGAPSFGSATAVFLYSILNARSSTATDTGTGTTSTSIDIEPGGVAIGIFQRGGGTHTWTGMTEDDEQSSVSGVASVASLESEEGETALSVSVSGGTGSQILLAVAAFR